MATRLVYRADGMEAYSGPDSPRVPETQMTGRVPREPEGVSGRTGCRETRKGSQGGRNAPSPPNVLKKAFWHNEYLNFFASRIFDPATCLWHRTFSQPPPRAPVSHVVSCRPLSGSVCDIHTPPVEDTLFRALPRYRGTEGPSPSALSLVTEGDPSL